MKAKRLTKLIKENPDSEIIYIHKGKSYKYGSLLLNINKASILEHEQYNTNTHKFDKVKSIILE